ncbi:uncharacterized protein MONBRDRAFT_31370 [Monosiga brevicollis MX1]|uniref:Elongin-A n=1 Tax=Monosiga brevicollis TaxID=81824 RepID=A9URJ3_MONBE|nr:uncharacterized protein MONBRDRAFT_31370 [Monosiga brevicollis MX1]EDQ91933.1 predicted protein [Monosiga brevicollis MX1]|eukprot:XP_001743219.1 hypothetical protein [Monosiga brevicollis MX1]
MAANGPLDESTARNLALISVGVEKGLPEKNCMAACTLLAKDVHVSSAMIIDTDLIAHLTSLHQAEKRKPVRKAIKHVVSTWMNRASRDQANLSLMNMQLKQAILKERQRLSSQAVRHGISGQTSEPTSLRDFSTTRLLAPVNKERKDNNSVRRPTLPGRVRPRAAPRPSTAPTTADSTGSVPTSAAASSSPTSHAAGSTPPIPTPATFSPRQPHGTKPTKALQRPLPTSLAKPSMRMGIPTLKDLCLERLISLRHDIEEVGDRVPIDLMRPVLEACDEIDLVRIENANPHLLGQVDHRWREICLDKLSERVRREKPADQTWRDCFIQ